MSNKSMEKKTFEISPMKSKILGDTVMGDREKHIKQRDPNRKTNK
jgi:hypothetical protein